MKKPAATVITSLIVLAFAAVAITAFGDSGPTEPSEKLTTAEKHEILARGKAEKLGIRRQIEEAAEKTARGLNQDQFDVTFYRVEIDVDIPTNTISGDVLMEAVARIDGLNQIELDLVNDLTIDSVYIPGAGPLSYSHSSNIIYVTLDKSYNDGDPFKVAVTYNGMPPTSGFVGFEFTSRYSIPVVSTLSEPYMARTWWPCKDRPDDKADSLDIVITCDTSLFCASNGNLIDTVRNGDGTWTFNYEVRYPITTYLFSLAISKYTTWFDWYHYSPTDSMRIDHHVYPDLYNYSLPRWGVTSSAMEILSGLFGEYPFLNEKYGHANFEWGGGMEHQTMTSMSGSWFGFDTNTVVHELAHQWWGNMITCNNWQEIWLNEGFASYSEALYWEVASGETRFKQEMSEMEYYSSGSIFRYDTASVWGIFSSIVYDKGAWVLHMLRRTVGDINFFNVLQNYYNSQYQYGDATTEQFKEICEQTSGMELDWFFDQWIYGTYHPVIEYSYYHEYDSDLDLDRVFLRLKQTQSAQPDYYAAVLDVEFINGVDVSERETFMDSRDSVYVFELSFAPAIVNIDPDNWLLNKASTAVWTYVQIPISPDSAVRFEDYSDTLQVLGGSGDNRFEIVSGAIPEGLELDSISGVIYGMPTEHGSFTFTVSARDFNNASYIYDNTYALEVGPGIGDPGDVNLDDAVDILDILFLIEYKYQEGDAPAEPRLADVNSDCEINILDILYLIEYKFQNGPEPVIGCPTL